MIRILIILLLCPILIGSCIKKSNVASSPQISFNKIIFDTISIIPNDSLNQFSIVVINYKVQNGEVGSKDSSSNNLLFTETNGGTSNFGFKLPNFKGFNTKYDAENGIFELIVNKELIQPNSLGSNIDKYWDVDLIDKLGRKSNTIKVGPIHIKQL